MPKGYTTIAGRNISGLGLVTIHPDNEVEYVHWGHFITEAVLGYCLEDNQRVTTSNVGTGDQSTVEKTINTWINNLFYSFKNEIKFWTLETLVFNHGVRGTSLYTHGIFLSSWEPTIWGFFMVSEFIALIMLMWILIKTIGQRALSTMNVTSRLFAWEKLKQIIFVALALSLLPIIIQLLMQLSSTLSNVIYAAILAVVGGDEGSLRFGVMNVGSLAMLLLNIILFFIECYFNFTYALRSLTVAALIIIGPIAIVLSLASEQYAKVYTQWFSELTANIFIQPIHAFAVGMVFALPANNRAFETILFLIATIPFANAMKKLLFPSAGMDSAMNSGTSNTSKGMMNGAKRAHDTVAGAAANGFSTISQHSNSNDESQSKEKHANNDSLQKSSSLSGSSTDTTNSQSPQSETSTVDSTQDDLNGGTIDSTQINDPETQASPEEANDINNQDEVLKEQQQEQQQLKSKIEGVSAYSLGAGVAAAGVLTSMAGGAMEGATGIRMGKNSALLGSAIYNKGQGLITKGKESIARGNATDAPSMSMPTALSTDSNPDATSAKNPMYFNAQSAYDSSDNSNNASMSKQQLEEAGISNVTSNDSSIGYDVDGNTEYGQEMANYNSLLKSLPEDERKEMIDQTGFNIEPITQAGEETGSYRVTASKSGVAAANNTNLSAGKNGALNASGTDGATPNIIPQIPAYQTTVDENGNSVTLQDENNNSINEIPFRVSPSSANFINNAEQSGTNVVSATDSTTPAQRISLKQTPQTISPTPPTPPSENQSDNILEGLRDTSKNAITMSNPLYDRDSTSNNNSTNNNNSNGGTSVSMSPDNLATHGISEVKDVDSENISFDVTKGSEYGQEISAYNDLLNSCSSPEERADLVKSTGYDVTQDNGDNFTVSANKEDVKQSSGTDLSSSSSGGLEASSPLDTPTMLPQVPISKETFSPSGELKSSVTTNANPSIAGKVKSEGSEGLKETDSSTGIETKYSYGSTGGTGGTPKDPPTPPGTPIDNLNP